MKNIGTIVLLLLLVVAPCLAGAQENENVPEVLGEQDSLEAFTESASDLGSDIEILQVNSAEEVDDFKTYAQTCTLKVFPNSIKSLRIGRFGLIIVSGGDFERGERVDWGTDDIISIAWFRFPHKIFSIVWIKKNAETGEFEVTVGDDDNCTGSITIR